MALQPTWKQELGPCSCTHWTHPADYKGLGLHFLPDTFLRLCSPVLSPALQMFRLGLQAEKWNLGSLGAFCTGPCNGGSACLTAPVGFSPQPENKAVQAVMLLCVRFTPALWPVKKDCSLSRTLSTVGLFKPASGKIVSAFIYEIPIIEV